MTEGHVLTSSTTHCMRMRSTCD